MLTLECEYVVLVLLKPIITHKFSLWDFVQLQLTFICRLAHILLDAGNIYATNCSNSGTPPVFTSSSEHLWTSKNSIRVFVMHSSAIFRTVWSQNTFVTTFYRQLLRQRSTMYQCKLLEWSFTCLELSCCHIIDHYPSILQTSSLLISVQNNTWVFWLYNI